MWWLQWPWPLGWCGTPSLGNEPSLQQPGLGVDRPGWAVPYSCCHSSAMTKEAAPGWANAGVIWAPLVEDVGQLERAGREPTMKKRQRGGGGAGPTPHPFLGSHWGGAWHQGILRLGTLGRLYVILGLPCYMEVGEAALGKFWTGPGGPELRRTP